jgi:hypothetical protein
MVLRFLKRFSLASAQWAVADQNTVFVGVEKFARIEGHAAKSQCQAAVADTLLDGLLRMGIECANADVDSVDVA